MLVPKEPGWYFAKWKIAEDGTRDAEHLTPSNKIECVEIYINGHDKEDSEYLMVAVGGVEKPQPIENFYWISPIEVPKERDYEEQIKNNEKIDELINLIKGCKLHKEDDLKCAVYLNSVEEINSFIKLCKNVKKYWLYKNIG